MFGAITPLTSVRSTQAMADTNDLFCLAALARMGHLRLTELARAAFPLASAESGQSSAERCIKRLLARAHIERRRNCMGTWSYVLLLGGVARLLRVGIAAQVQDKLSVWSPQFLHQMFTARYLLERTAVDGAEVWGGYAIGHGMTPVSLKDLKRFKKIPDGWIAPRHSGSESGAGLGAVSVLDWVEGENRSKSQLETLRVLQTAVHSGEWLDAQRTIKLGRVVIVYSEKQGHEDALCRGIATLLRERPELDEAALLEALIFVRCDVDLGLRWRSCEELTGSTVYARYLARQTQKNGGRPAWRPDPRHTRVITEEQRRREEDEYLEDLARRRKKFGPH
jgi:hypothetical protein